MNLELQAMRWLRWEVRCPVVLTERTPREWSCGRPDVLGVTAGRHMIEVEIKRTISDFRQDKFKDCRRRRHVFRDRQPRHFYYLVVPDMVDRVRPELPPWAGLLTTNGTSIEVVFKSPTNYDGQRLAVKECIRLVYLVSNEAISAWEFCARAEAKLKSTIRPT